MSFELIVHLHVWENLSCQTVIQQILPNMHTEGYSYHTNRNS